MRLSPYSVVALSLVLLSSPFAHGQRPDPPRFYATGKAEWQARMTLPLMARPGSTLVIGTLSRTGVVEISLKPEQVNQWLRPLPAVIKDYQARAKCTSGRLQLTEGTRIYRFLAAYLPQSFGGGEVAADTVFESDGNKVTVNHQFWYVDRTTVVKGQLACADGPVTFDLKLTPGWNHVAYGYRYNPKTKKYSGENYLRVEAKDSFRGSWKVYEPADD